MKNVLLLVEGETEERFVNNVLKPSWENKEIYVYPFPLYGTQKYHKVRKDIFRLLNDPTSLVSTFIDYYGLPNSFPGKDNVAGRTAYERVEYLESQLAIDINNPRFLPYYSLHEFEAMLFSDPTIVAETMADLRKERELNAICDSFNTPEEINDSPATCPSARLRSIFSQYQKPLHGSLISQRIGLDKIRQQCPHLNSWLTRIESL